MDKLKFINDQMKSIGIPYEFGEWTSPIVYPYSIGEITEEPTTTEDGLEQSTMIITLFHRGEFIDLERAKATIKNHFHPVHGLHGWTDSGAIVVFFDSSFYIPTGEADLKKLQINLQIKEWKVY